VLYKREKLRQNLLVNNSEKKNYCKVFLRKQLTVFSSIDGLYVDGTFKSAPKFSTNYLQFMDSLCATWIFLSANKHQRSYGDVFRHAVSEAAKLGVNVFQTIVHADFETTIHNAVTTVWPGLEVKACRFYLGQSWWRKIQSLGLSKHYGKKDSEISHFLKKIFGLSLLPPAELCDCFALEFLFDLPNDKLVGQFCDYLL